MLEPFDPKIHDASLVAEWIYDTDPEFNLLVFGQRKVALPRIRKAMEVHGTFFSAPQLCCIRIDGRLVGMVSGYAVSQKSRMEAKAGRAFLRAFGFGGFLKRLPTFLKMDRILSGKMNPKGYYIVYLFLVESERGKGTGAGVIRELAARHPILYLHVSAENVSAIRFYEKSGFHPVAETRGRIRSQIHGARFMERNNVS